MADNNNDKELKELRSLVTRLAKTIDYKNLMLIEKDGILDDKSVEIAVLTAKKKWAEEEMYKAIAEKENMSKERSSAICVLIQENAEKDKLLEEKSTTIAELIKEKEKMVKEMSDVGCKLEVKEEKMDCDWREIIVEKDRLINEYCGAITKLTAEKNQFLYYYLQGLENVKNMKLELEKLNHDLECRKKETEASRKRLKEKEEQVDNADSKVQTAEETILSTGKIEQVQLLEDVRGQLSSLRNQLEEKTEALNYLEHTYNVLMVKQVSSNQELQAACIVAIHGFEFMKRRNTVIGIKRIGDLGVKPFRNACFKRFCNGKWEEKFGNVEDKSLELKSSWLTYLSDPAWQPFKLEVIDGKQMEVIDEDDPKLKELREEWGEEAYNGVTEALIGLNEYNASGRYPVSELWNFKQDRIATLKEVIQYVFKRWGMMMDGNHRH